MYRIIDGSATHLDRAANIWARATAARDGDEAVAPLGESRPILRRVLDLPNAFLLVAEEGSGEAAAFAAVAPALNDASSAELYYLGVDPDHWGRGAARALLASIPAILAERGFREARLSVYADNIRAVRLYEAMGWRRLGRPMPHPRSGRPEQRYAFSLRQPGPGET